MFRPIDLVTMDTNIAIVIVEDGIEYMHTTEEGNKKGQERNFYLLTLVKTQVKLIKLIQNAQDIFPENLCVQEIFPESPDGLSHASG